MTDEIRCDCCNRAVDPAEGGWTYFTPSTAMEKQAEHGEGFWAEDEAWFVCVPCEPFVEADDARGLMLRWMQFNDGEKQMFELIAGRMVPHGPKAGVFAAGVLRSFLANRDRQRRDWEDVVTPAGAGPQQPGPR